MRATSAVVGVLVSAVAWGGDYAAWAKVNTDVSWTAATEQAVAASSLASHVPRDVAGFCPTYAGLQSPDRTRFWVGLLSAMAKFESNFDPSERFEESFPDSRGAPVISRGLLQLSQESANGYGCGIEPAAELHDPLINLACAVRILDRWVVRDGVIAGKSGNKDLGGARYWSVLRANHRRLPAIRQLTNALGFCRK